MWKRVFVFYSAAASIVSGCASSDPMTESTNADEQSIVRGTVVPNSGVPSVSRPYVVLVQFETFDGRVSLCSGTYFAPRVVLTAAHCVPSGNVGRARAYWGNNWEADQDLRFELPAPDQPSVWAKLDSWEVHPNYATNEYDADIAVVYLDRKPPFDPLPLYRNRLDSSWTNQLATLVGWGANKALTEDIQVTEGFGVKRTGRAPILGTPSLADYGSEVDPALLSATVRSHYVKINGRNPYPNACSGDSGGPILVNRYGQDYVAGVASRTGLWCENFSLYTRIDPYLPFLDAAYRRGGQEKLVPSLDCVDTRADGKLTAYFGYKNDNGVSISVPYSATRNYLPLDVKNERPALFKPGNNRFQFGIDFTAGQTVQWKLSPPNGPVTDLRVTAASPRCGDTVGRKCARYCEATLASACAADFNTNWDACITGCTEGYQQFANTSCEDEWGSFLSCVAATPPAVENWACEPWMDSMPRALACDPLVSAALECLYPPSP